MNKEEVLIELKKINAKKILLQIPDGLKPDAFDLFNYYSSIYSVVISSSSFYGACDIGNQEVYGKVDAIVQFGHTEIPNIKYPIPVFFVEYFYKKIDLDDSIFDVLKSDKINNVGLLSSVQYYNEMKYVKSKLERLGFNVIIGENDKRLKYPGQVLGCNFSSAHSVSLYVDAYLLVSTGMFHAIGAQLSSDKSVYILDLNEKTIRNIKDNTEKFLRRRYAKIERAMDAKRFCVVIDTKIGQYRKRLAENIYSKIISMGKDAILVTADNANPLDFENFMCDAVVFTGCPRVSIDDEDKFKMPVLTPVEFNMLFGFNRNQKYVMDEIVSVDYSPIK